MSNQYEVLGKAPTPEDLKKLSPSNDLCFRFHDQVMDPWSVTAIEAVAEMIETLGHATPPVQSIDHQGHQLM